MSTWFRNSPNTFTDILICTIRQFSRMSDKDPKPGIIRRISVGLLGGLQPRTVDRDWPIAQHTYPDCDRWRCEPPIDIASPLSIKRNNARRVTIGAVWEHQCDPERTILKDTTWQRRSELSDYDVIELDDYSDAELKSERRILGSDLDSILLTPINTGRVTNEECHVNTVFNIEDINNCDSFVTAFGKKGKNIGEYQDAKNITCLTRGRLLITDLVNSRLQMFSDSAKAMTVFSPNEVNQPWATAITKENYIAVTLCKDQCVKVLNTDGDVINTFGEDVFERPTGLATDKSGHFVVCDSVANKVSMFDNQGQFIRFLGNPDVVEECFSKPCYVCVSVNGDIIVSDGGNHKVKVFDADGNFVKSFGSFGRDDKQFKCPYGVTTNKYGDIFVADHYNSRISMFNRDGVFIRHIVTSDHGLVHPQGLAISTDLRMYVTHGHLKASEILEFKLTYDISHDYSCVISHV